MPQGYKTLQTYLNLISNTKDKGFQCTLINMSIREIAKQAREQRLEGDHYDNDSFPLVGYCFDNAYVLYELLNEKGYDPSIVAGLSEQYAEELLREVPRDEINKVEDLAGLVHYWVEADGYIIDIAAEHEPNLGEIIVQNSLPETYHRLNDSYEYGRETLKSARSRRCSYCGGKNGYCNCPKE